MPTLNQITTTTAVALAATSGAIATYGLTKVIPGSEFIVVGLGVLFEAAKLTSLALIHQRKLPTPLKAGLGGIAAVLMASNIAGVSGVLSSAYEERAIAAQASAHTVALVNESAVGDLRRQLDATDAQIASANAALVKASDDRSRARAARAIVDRAQHERDALAAKLRDATTTQAHDDAAAMKAGGEFAAVAFLASVIGVSADAAAKIVITVLAAIPDSAAALLLWASSYKPAVVRRRKVTRRRSPPSKSPASIVRLPRAQKA